MNASEARIKYKESKCLMMMKEFANALQELEVIPMKLRDEKAHLLFAFLYSNANMKKQAISSYKEALRLSPLCFEAIKELANLGEPAEDIATIVNQSMDRSQSSSLYRHSRWLDQYIESLGHKRSGDYVAHCQTLEPVLDQFPNSYSLLLTQGVAALDSERYESAYIIYKQLRQSESFSYNKMDRFALMLHHKGDSTELNRLANDVLTAAVNRPQGWLIVALYCDLKNQPDKCMSFIDKAISLDYKYALSFVLKGKYLLLQGQSKQAAVAYFQANILEKDLLTLRGLMDANMNIGRVNEALSAAKEAVELMPSSSTAYVLMGKMASQSTNGLNEVKYRIPRDKLHCNRCPCIDSIYRCAVTCYFIVLQNTYEATRIFDLISFHLYI